jgi:hypothetical protein
VVVKICGERVCVLLDGLTKGVSFNCAEDAGLR